MKKLYLVKWDDAWASTRVYFGNDDDYMPLRTQNIGWVVEENDEAITLCGSFTPEIDSYRNTITIPWGMVVSMEELI